MTTTWYSFILIAVGVIGVAGLVFWPRIAPFLQPRPKPQKHEGATEKYAGELHRAAATLPSPELIRPAEQMDADHEALAEIGRALDHFGEVMTDALSRFLRNQPTVLLRLPSSIEQTGEFPVVEMVGGK